MKLKVIPVFQFLIAGAVILLIDKFLPAYTFNFSYQYTISIILSGSAFLILTASLMSFQKAKTTVDPAHPEKASNLVIGGIYRLTRNPMYLAILLLLLAFAIKKGNPFGLLPIIGFIWSMTNFQIKPEEEALGQIFGKPYLEYKEKVRRWI